MYGFIAYLGVYIGMLVLGFEWYEAMPFAFAAFALGEKK